MVRFFLEAVCFMLLFGMPEAQMQHAVGIDLGTTMTVISRYYMVGDGTQGETFINEQGERLTPSVVHFESGPDGDVLVGLAAKNLLVKDSASTVYGVKRLLGKTFDAAAPFIRELTFAKDVCTKPKQTRVETVRLVGACPNIPFNEQLKRVAHSSYRPSSPPSFGGVCVWQWEQWWPVELISALVLKEVKQSAERAIGAPVHKAVVTIPAYFGEPQKQATRVAAQIAGLDVLRLLAEPTAAAISYARNKMVNFATTERLLVFDLGGGTFDVSILKYEGGGDFKVLAVTGDANLGGEDFDVRIAKFVLAEYVKEYGDVSTEKRAKLFPKCLRSGKQAKEKLSFRASVDVVIETVGPDGDDFVLKLSRTKVEQLCSDLLAKLMPIVRKGVRDANLQISDIDRVLIVGGSSRIPKVRELLKLEFNRDPEQLLNPDEAIADGAAVMAFQLANPGLLHSKDQSLLSFVEPMSQNSHEITVKDVAAHSLGVTYWAGDCKAGDIKDDELAERLVREGAKSGDVRISLRWDDESDLDLHVITPSSEKISFKSKTSKCGGKLDVDMNLLMPFSTKPVENIYWGHGMAPHGPYTVLVSQFINRNKLNETSFFGEVEVSGVVKSFRGKLTESRDSAWRFSTEASKHTLEVAQFRFDGDKKLLQQTSTKCERKMKLIIPKNSALPFSTVQNFVVSALLIFTETCADLCVIASND